MYRNETLYTSQLQAKVKGMKDFLNAKKQAIETYNYCIKDTKGKIIEKKLSKEDEEPSNHSKYRQKCCEFEIKTYCILRKIFKICNKEW